MSEVTYLIKVKVERSTDYSELEQALYKANATDVDLLETYND